jgi:hypothetical protein
MEMEQRMACLLDKMKAEIRTNQAKVDANLKEIKEEIMARLEAMIQNNQDEMLAKMETNQERMEA